MVSLKQKIFLLFIPALIGAEEAFKIDKAVYISEIYREGAFLIYDCQDRHFACVDQKGFGYCSDLRQSAMSLKKYDLPCAPLKEFSSMDECVQMQYRLIYSVVDKGFCIRQADLIKG